MNKLLQRGLWLMLAAALLLNGCGRKEAPQMTADGVVKPTISSMSHSIEGNLLEVKFIINGDANGVGYQIDRAEMDPYCQCPGFWRRYFEQPAFAKQNGREMVKLLNLKTDKREFAFRIRAIDTFGNFSPWSKMIRARGVDPYNK